MIKLKIQQYRQTDQTARTKEQLKQSHYVAH